MKISNYVSCKTLIMAMACGFAASTPMQAREAGANSVVTNSGDSARLVVTRAANFGYLESVNLFVDGVQVGDLGLNQSYDATLSPGPHVLTISTNPKTYAQKPTQRRVNAKPGQTYVFTAVWRDSERATLVED
jgi:hypothetical protein